MLLTDCDSRGDVAYLSIQQLQTFKPDYISLGSMSLQPALGWVILERGHSS